MAAAPICAASKFPAENAIRDLTHHIDTREREFAVLDYPAAPPTPAMAGKVEKLEDGFYSISGGAVDANGKLYFVDKHQQRIYGWSRDEGLTIERDNPADPVNLAIDKAGDILVLSSLGAEGTLYSFKPGSPETEMTVIAPTPATAHPGATALLPGNYWNNGEFKDQIDLKTYRYTTLPQMFARDMAAPKAREYVSPDGSLFLPDFRTFQQGPPDGTGWRFSDQLDTYGFVSAKAGSRVLVSNESEGRTYSGLVGDNGTVTDLKLFADRGGESVAVGGRRQGLSRQWPGAGLCAGRQAGRADRCAGTAAAASVRRRGWADAVHPHPSRALRRQDLNVTVEIVEALLHHLQRRGIIGLFDLQEGALDSVSCARPPARSSSR